MNTKELNKTAKTVAVETVAKTERVASVLAGRVMQLATNGKARIGESTLGSRLSKLGPESRSSTTKEAIQNPAFWAYGGSLAAGAVAIVKPVRERITTRTKQVGKQARDKFSEYIGGKPQEALNYAQLGEPSAPGMTASEGDAPVVEDNAGNAGQPIPRDLTQAGAVTPVRSSADAVRENLDRS